MTATLLVFPNTRLLKDIAEAVSYTNTFYVREPMLTHAVQHERIVDFLLKVIGNEPDGLEIAVKAANSLGNLNTMNWKQK